MQADRTAAPYVGGFGWGVILLLALAVFVNYIDRGVVATAAPLIKDQLALSASQMGLLISAFFWSYAPSQFIAAWLIERLNAYRTLALGLAVWSLATIGSGFAGGLISLIGLRFLLGVGESAAFPCASKLLAQHLPANRLGAANGVIGLGLSLGPAFGTFVGGMLMAQLGWRNVFLIFGLASLLWLGPWLWSTRKASSKADLEGHEPAPSFPAILKHREAWGACIGHFAANYTFYFVISWLPLYLVKSRGFTVPQMAEIGGAIYVVYAASTVISGWLVDRWMRAGASANLARKTAAWVCQLSLAVCLVACAVGDRTISVISLFGAGVAMGINMAGVYAIGQTLAGPRAAGKWIALQNAVGNMAGIIGPLVTGFVVDRTGQFFWAFIIGGGMAVVGALGWGVVIRKVAPVVWPSAADSAGFPANPGTRLPHNPGRNPS
jgi:MFS family permease